MASRKQLIAVWLSLAGTALAQNWHGSPAADPNAKFMDRAPYLLGVITGTMENHAVRGRVVPMGYADSSGYPSYAVGVTPSGDTGHSEIFRGGVPLPLEPYQTLWMAGVPRAAGDLDGDGRPDLLTYIEGTYVGGHFETVVRIYWGNGNGVDTSSWITFSYPGADTLKAADFARNAAIADIDGDGRDDLILLSDSRSTLWIYKFDSTRSIPAGPWFEWNFGGKVGTTDGSLFIGDADNDGLLDIIQWVAYNGHLDRTTEILWGRQGLPPDTAGRFTFDGRPLKFFPIYDTARTDIVHGNTSGLGGDSIFIFRGFTHRFSPEECRSLQPAKVLLAPTLLDGNLPFSVDDVFPGTSVNGAPEPSMLANVSAYDGFTASHAALLYSAGVALDTRFDAVLPLSDDAAGNLEPEIVQVGDLDGDHVPDLAFADNYYGPFSSGGSHRYLGRVFLVRGSSDYPHKPLKVSDPGRVFLPGQTVVAAPNPFREETIIAFRSPTEVPAANLRVSDISGRTKFQQSGRNLAPGAWEFLVPASDWPSGVYQAVLAAGEASTSITLVHMK